MDTKLKKFSRSTLSKTLAFFLALLFFTLFVLGGTNLLFSALSNTEEADIIESYLTNGSYSAIRGAGFEKTLSDYIETAINSKLIFKNGSKENFENYQSAYLSKNQKALKKAENEVIHEIKIESGSDNFLSVFTYLSEGKITLKKIADHTCYLDPSAKLLFRSDSDGIQMSVYTADDGFFESYEDFYYSKYYDYDDEEDYTYTTSLPSAELTNSEGVVVGTTAIKTPEQLSAAHSDSSIPQSIKNKAENPDNVIEICSAVFGDTETTYDGYYEVTVDKSMLKAEDNDNSLFGENIKTEADFKAKAEFYASHLNDFKHASIAIIDSKTGKPIFSTFEGVSESSSVNDLIDNCEFAFAYNSKSDNIDYVNYPAGDSLAAHKISSLAASLGSALSDFSENYTIVVGVDNYFNSSVKSDSTEPFESSLFESKELERSVKSELSKTVIFFAFFLILTVYLVLVAGRKPEDNEIHMAPADGIFTLLRTCIDLGAIAGIVTGAVFCYADAIDNILTDKNRTLSVNAPVNAWHYVIIVICALGVCAFLLDWILYLARHIKNRSLFKNFMLGRIIVSIKQKIKSRPKKEKIYKDVLNDVLKKIALFVLLPNLVIGLPSLFSVIDHRSVGGFFFGILLVIYDLCALGYAVYYAYNVRKLFNALDEIKNGNYNVQIETGRMPGSIRNTATDIMHLGEGLKRAVASAVKEEKMKAELITNVSHDLKTPLTSIINYTDLLSRCEITDETALSYIAVLKEKSERLKKLIEDLVEASKASSGAINVDFIKMSLNELALQIEGEYEDEFEAKGLELIVEEGDEELYVFADGKLSHRVLDNLMSNVKKYAMPHTRVYMTLSKEPGGASITIKNISEGRLNISPEELKARFVRGDSSRTSEGNGLGLSIADNLTTLQGGTLEIEIIGDLFSAKVTFRSAR